MIRPRRTISGFPIIVMILALLLPGVLSVERADAATVYGRVICPSGVTCPPQLTMRIIKDGQLVNVLRTDANRDYSIFLKTRGQYIVEVTLGSRTYRATIRSAANPIRQDIRLQ